MMRKYRLGYLAWNYEISKTSINGKFFTISFDENTNSSQAGRTSEIVVATNNYKNAVRVSQLISSGLSLLDACAFTTMDSLPEIVPLQKDGELIPRSWGSVYSWVHRDNIPLAALIAAKSSFKKKIYLALLKYQLGCEIHSNNVMDLYPEYHRLVKTPWEHLRLSNAVIIFYSVIEELGLELRASYKNPSKIKGKWNPAVKNELIERLQKAKINLNETINWSRRSTPSKIHKLRKPDILKKSEYSYGQIRDSEIDLLDAIAYASWLRSRIAAHKLDEAFTSLSLYDVANVNFLARKLLLDSINV